MVLKTLHHAESTLALNNLISPFKKPPQNCQSSNLLLLFGALTSIIWQIIIQVLFQLVFFLSADIPFTQKYSVVSVLYQYYCNICFVPSLSSVQVV